MHHISKCGQREQTPEREIFLKATVDWRRMMNPAQQIPAQVCHVLRVEELREQLEVEEEDGDRQEEEEEVESGEGESKRVRHVDDHGWR